MSSGGSGVREKSFKVDTMDLREREGGSGGDGCVVRKGRVMRPIGCFILEWWKILYFLTIDLHIIIIQSFLILSHQTVDYCSSFILPIPISFFLFL